MRLTRLALYLAAASAAVAPLATREARADVSFELSIGTPPGEPIASVDVFYDQLAPYGMWVEDPQVGMVFMPDEAGYVPYTNGHWEYTDVGMVWISAEPFAWVTSHYGRWWFSDRYQRWAWVPDTTWGPSWVDWHESGGYLGWSPLAPQVVIDAGYSPPIAAWHFCPAERIVDANVTSYYVPRERVMTFQRQARPVTATATIDNRRVVVGPSSDVLRAHHVAVQPRRIEAKTLGRMSSDELRTVETRAKERAPVVQQQNQQRVQQHPQLKQAAPAAPPAQRGRVEQPRGGEHPPRMEPPRVEPPRAEPPRGQQPQTTQPQTTQPQTTQPPRQQQPERRTVEPRTQPRQPTRQLEPRPQVQQPQQVRPEPQQQRPEPQQQRPQPQPQARPEPQQQRPQPQQVRPEPQRPQPQPQARPEPQRREQPRKDDRDDNDHRRRDKQD